MSDEFFKALFGEDSSTPTPPPTEDDATFLESAKGLFGMHQTLRAAGFTADESIQLLLGVIAEAAQSAAKVGD